jgi:hypothetical protein
MIRWCYTHNVNWWGLTHAEMKRDSRECTEVPPDDEEDEEYRAT